MAEKNQRESREKLVIYILLRGSQHSLRWYIIHLVNHEGFSCAIRLYALWNEYCFEFRADRSIIETLQCRCVYIVDIMIGDVCERR